MLARMICGVLVSAGIVVIVVGAHAEFSWISSRRDLNEPDQKSNASERPNGKCDLGCLAEEKNRIGEKTDDKISTTKKCLTDLYKFWGEFEKGSSWAIEMFDASSKIPNGLIHGNRYQLGNYDQCLNVYSPENSLRGKYCLANVKISIKINTNSIDTKNQSNHEFSPGHDVYKSVLEKFKTSDDFTKKIINSFDSGLCIPDSCQSEDAETLLRTILYASFDELLYDIKITVPEHHCTVYENKPLSKEAKILGSIIIIIIVWVLFCTVWDRIGMTTKREKGLGKFHSYLEAFSLARNAAKFGELKTGGDMNIFNGMKCLSMFLIIMGHRGMASLGGPFLNPQFLEERYRKIQNILLLNGTLIVDTFFLIGGYLTFLTLFKESKSGRKLNFLQIYAYRWLRIVPVYMLVILFYAHLLEYLGTGPVWTMKVGREAERCRKNWWTNFLFVNNYVNTDSLCMFQSWYITCDMHFTLLAPFVVQIIVKSPKKGLFILLLLIIGSILVTFVIVYQYKYDGVLRVYLTTFEDLPSNFTFNRVYIRTHHRGTPYFSGMAAAYLYFKLKEAGYKFTKKYVWLYSILSAISGLSAICGAWIFYIPGRRYNAMENALYAAIHRLLWSFSMSWIALAGGTKALGILEPFLSKKIFTPFSKLSYSMFLVHGAIQLYTTSTLRVPEYMSFPKLYWMTCGDVILSFAVAFLLHIFFEAPIKCIQSMLFSRKTVKR